MQLVILAAGHGTRFGGLKQLAAVGPNGEAIMDYTAQSAATCGFDGIVLVVRDEIRAEIEEHVRRRWSAELPIAIVCQPPLPGTAQAVSCARPVLDGPFGVANADDLYGRDALRKLVEHFAVEGGPYLDDPAGSFPHVAVEHLVVCYRLDRTVLTAEPVTRGICQVSSEQFLEGITEQRVTLQSDGRFSASPIVLGDHEQGVAQHVLGGDELVSMNLFGFHLHMLDRIDEALADFDSERGERRELLLPQVVGALIDAQSDTFAVVEAKGRCVGITHKKDTSIVRSEITLEYGAAFPLQALHGT